MKIDINVALSFKGCYQSDEHVKRMIILLIGDSPIGRKEESILQWHRLRYLDPHQSQSENGNELQSLLKSGDNYSISDCLTTKSFKLSVCKHGSFVETEIIDSFKEQDKTKETVAEVKM